MILVFLASLRSTLVTAVSIPLSVVLALIVLWTRDLSLNMLTLGALTIAIGRVVDDSIVVLENIKRHLSYGEERQSAILAAVKEVVGAVTASTLTTVAVFLPIGLVGGMVGELFGSFSLTITAALLASLLVSLTVVPVLSYWFLRAPKGSAENPDEARRKAEEKEARSKLQQMYVQVLGFATRRRVVSVVIAVVVLIGTFGMAPLLKTTLFDQGEQEVLSIKQELTPGTSLAAADEAARKVEKLLADDKAVKEYQVTVGSSGFMAAFGGGTGANQASYQVTLKDPAEYDATEKRLGEALGKLDGIGDTTFGEAGWFRQPGPERRGQGRRRGRPDEVLRNGAQGGGRPQGRQRRPERPVAEHPPDLGQGQRQGRRRRFHPGSPGSGRRRCGEGHPLRQGDHGRHRA